MTRERTKSTYDVVFEAPAPRGGGRNGGQLFEQLEKVIAAGTHPVDGDEGWASIVTCGSLSGANSILTSVKSGTRRLPIPAEQFLFTTRTDADSETSKLYAKYIGEAGAVQVAAAVAEAEANAPADSPAPKKRGRPRKVQPTE